MSAKRKKTTKAGEPRALELIEEAVHLLRRAPMSTHLIYFLGAGAWVLGFLFFWAHTTWFAPSGARLAWSALGLVGLFALLKVAQAEFCARLLAQRLGEKPAAWSWRRGASLAAAQLPVQAWGVLAIPLAALAIVPLGWVYGFYQHAVVIGSGEGLASEARALTRRWPGQNHVGLILLSTVAFAVWINIASAFYFLPWLANRMLGLDNLLGLTGWSFFNTTFFASIGALTWLAVDPLVKAFYVLRVFHGRAQQSGEDLRVELREARAKSLGGRVSAAAVSVVVLGAVLMMPSSLRAEAASFVGASAEVGRVVSNAPEHHHRLRLIVANEDRVQPAGWGQPALPSEAGAAQTQRSAGVKNAAVDAPALDKALDEVLKRRDFQWQLRPLPREPKAEEEVGPITKFIREGMATLREMADTVRREWQRFKEWLDEIFGSEKKEKRERDDVRGGGASMGMLRVVLYALIGALLLAIIVVVVMMVRSARRQAAPALVGRAITLAQPDLRDEATHAAQMPSDGWLALAKEQMAKGEWRLALRALYLATLARHAADGLLTLAKHKTNLDYERELRRRAVTRPEVPAQFAARRLDFEAVWYGRTPASEGLVRDWLEQLEGVVLSR